MRKKQFGASSEQTKEQLDGQLSLLFNEAEAYAAPPGPQKAKTTQVSAHTRKQSSSVKDIVPDNNSGGGGGTPPERGGAGVPTVWQGDA